MAKNYNDDEPENVWARPEMSVTFRAEIMPGRDIEERTYRIRHVARNGRVMLYDFPGEYRETAFEAVNFLREKVLKDQNS